MGAMEALFLALMSIINQGDEVLLPDPFWPNYEAQILLAGGKPIFVPTKEEKGWVLHPEDHNLVVISDECYEKIIYQGKHQSIASLKDMRSRTIVINSFSKAYAMTGWRVGYALGDEEVIKQMTKLQENVASCASSVSQEAALAAMRSGDGATEEMFQQYRLRRSLLLEEIEKTPMISCSSPQGAFYAFINIKKLNQKSWLP